MLPLKPVVLFLAAGAAAAPSAPPQATPATIQDVNRDVAIIDASVRKLTRLTQSFSGGLASGLGQFALLLAVFAGNFAGNFDSSRLPRTLPVDEFVGLVRHVNRTLAVDNPLAVDAFIAKKAEFERAGVAPLIGSAFKVLLAGHQDFSNNILSRVPPGAPLEVQAQGKGDVELISEALRRGIRAFQRRT